PGDDGVVDVVLEEKVGAINPDLTVGAAVTNAARIQANSGLAFQGMALCGEGFLLTGDEYPIGQ
ncbi:MAG TPA: hypothetical protein VII54_03175, partial [Gaiellaceae bacterium]